MPASSYHGYALKDVPPPPPGSSSSSSADNDKYSSFLDAMLNHLCCAQADSPVDPLSGRPPQQPQQAQQSQQQEAQPHRQRERRSLRRQPSNSNNQQQVQRRFSSPPPITGSDNLRHNGSRLDESYDSSRGKDGPNNGPETTILPHLRFHPCCSTSSLQDFYDLFLAEDAPHSFKLFHESNGDENVQVSPWKSINATETKMENDGDPSNDNRHERTITFQTKITPGSSSNPLSPSDQANTSNNHATTIPLVVTIRQSLLKSRKRWTLECEFSFDFQPASESSVSIGGVGKKLGTGLGQYLMSNVVKGSTVNVVVTLSECDEVIDMNGAPSRGMMGSSYGNPHRVGSIENAEPLQCVPCGVNLSGDATAAKAPGKNGSNWNEGEGFLSCLSHPLLLPPEGLCSGVGTSPLKKSSGNGLLEESGDPAQVVGASLLSAIQAKNAPSNCSTDDGKLPLSDPSLATAPLRMNESKWSKDLTITHLEDKAKDQQSNEKPREQEEERGEAHDVLASNTSRGSLKMKHLPSFNSSFEMERAPSTVSATMMRRMLLEKDVAAKNAASTSGDRESQDALNAPGSNGDGSRLVNAPNSTSNSAPDNAISVQPQGLSMRIDMAITHGLTPNNSGNQLFASPSTTSSLSASAFSRSASFVGLDEKIRRGLRKRIARSWIAWAESWCMRTWEEERANPTGGALAMLREGRKGMENPSNRRKKMNVRPSVRRIGEPISAKGNNTKAKKTNKALSPTTKNGWKRLQADSSSGNLDKSLWMSLNNEEECGVEVACTMTSPSESSTDSKTKKKSSSSFKRSSSAPSLPNLNELNPPSKGATEDVVGEGVPTKQQGGKTSLMKKRLNILKKRS
eukprot:CAMPEP_0183721932 /NCGR_PEP_ID=MMETSP0737-20130205/14038_1 /TAXON_ID=385413 /ORGANISM="Thalassiosira miniscula, Strain CCMP1093" /LENGTH=853 /DNA_ID=CAMNT_0025952001 /DNA_START=423 /DNA_END=2984 /DNA_ORIENTATION=+